MDIGSFIDEHLDQLHLASHIVLEGLVRSEDCDLET